MKGVEGIILDFVDTPFSERDFGELIQFACYQLGRNRKGRERGPGVPLRLFILNRQDLIGYPA